MKATNEKFAEYRDKIYNLIWKLKRNKNKPDMHSFKAFIKNGVIWVDYDGDKKMWVVVLQRNGVRDSADYVNPAYLANQLAFLDLDLESVEI